MLHRLSAKKNDLQIQCRPTPNDMEGVMDKALIVTFHKEGQHRGLRFLEWPTFEKLKGGGHG